MYRNLKKMWPLAAASLVAFTSIVIADDSAQMRNLENRVSALEQRKNANGMINPNGRPGAKNGQDVFITADALLWKAVEDNLGFVAPSDNTAAGPIDDDIKHPSFKWRWGWRVGIGYELPHDGWDLYLNWTHLTSRAHKNVGSTSGGDCCTTPSTQTLVPTWIDPAGAHGLAGGGSSPLVATLAPTSAVGRWKMNLNEVDLELGRQFFTSKWLTVRPHMGLRWAQVNQKFDVDLDGLTAPNGNTGDVIRRDKCNFSGVGLRAGLDTQWGLGSGFSLYGNLAVAILYGHFHVQVHERFVAPCSDDTCGPCAPCTPTPPAFPDVNRGDAESRYPTGKAITDLALGLRWDTNFADDRFHFGIQIGWEQHLFFEQNQFIHFADDVAQGIYYANQGDLALQGWTLSARFDF